MAENDAIITLAEVGSVCGTYLAMYFSFTFAYLTVAYFVAASLSRFQSLAISGLYVLSGTLSGGTAIGYGDTWLRLRDRESTIVDEVWVFTHAVWLEGLVTLLIASGFVSLYFFYDARKRGQGA